MDADKINKIRNAAIIFRNAIENSVKLSQIIITFNRFPHGSCGEASLLLAKYLEKQGLGYFQYVLGGRNNQSHAWLLQDDIIVDITADQFDDVNSPVIVTTDNSWHSQFEGEIQHLADINNYDKHFTAVAWAAYDEIQNNIVTK